MGSITQVLKKQIGCMRVAGDWPACWELLHTRTVLDALLSAENVSLSYLSIVKGAGRKELLELEVGRISVQYHLDFSPVDELRLLRSEARSLRQYVKKNSSDMTADISLWYQKGGPGEKLLKIIHPPSVLFE